MEIEKIAMEYFDNLDEKEKIQEHEPTTKADVKFESNLHQNILNLINIEFEDKPIQKKRNKYSFFEAGIYSAVPPPDFNNLKTNTFSKIRYQKSSYSSKQFNPPYQSNEKYQSKYSNSTFVPQNIKFQQSPEFISSENILKEEKNDVKSNKTWKKEKYNSSEKNGLKEEINEKESPIIKKKTEKNVEPYAVFDRICDVNFTTFQGKYYIEFLIGQQNVLMFSSDELFESLFKVSNVVRDSKLYFEKKATKTLVQKMISSFKGENFNFVCFDVKNDIFISEINKNI